MTKRFLNFTLAGVFACQSFLISRAKADDVGSNDLISAIEQALLEEQKNNSSETQTAPANSDIGAPVTIGNPILGNNNGNNNSNSNTNTNPANRKVIPQIKFMKGADVPDTYSCPLFETNAYSGLTAAVDSLSAAVNTVPECRNNTGSLNVVQQNSDQIKNAITSLNKYMDNPDAAAQNTALIEDNLRKAIQGANNIGDVFKSNSLLNSECGKQVMGAGKAILAFNDVLNNLAPFALLAASVNPSISLAMKYSLMGGVFLTSSVSALGKIIGESSYNMDKDEHRRALLQNVCQFSKVDRKYNFLQLAYSGKIKQVTEELSRSSQIYNLKLKTTDSQLNQLLTYKTNIESKIEKIGKDLVKDQIDLKNISRDILNSTNDDFACNFSKNLAQMNSNENEFPGRILVNYQFATKFYPEQTRFQLMAIQSMDAASLEQISNAKTSKDCAQAGKSWISNLNQASQQTEALLNQARLGLNSELNKNNKYRAWKFSFDKAKETKNNFDRFTKVMQELAKQNSVIYMSEMSEKINSIRDGLMGRSGIIPLGKSPVLSWIDHTKSILENDIGKFLVNLKTLQQGSMSLNYLKKRKSSLHNDKLHYQQFAEDSRDSVFLNNLNLQFLPNGTRQHELACNQLKVAWVNWTSAIQHLGSMQLMCDMIDPYLDSNVERSLVNFCRGNQMLNGLQFSSSGISDVKNELTRKRKDLWKASIRDFSKIINKRFDELNCSTPDLNSLSEN